MLGLIPGDGYTKFRKRYINVRDIDTIDNHLANQEEKHMGVY